MISPGVYQLELGDRVADAIAAAGGPTDGADLETLNQARRLRDGEQLKVAVASASARSLTLAVGTKLDINTANEAQLDLLPGIGAAYAKRITDSRQLDGPFKSINDLVARKVLPQSTFDQISDLITVGP